jgi:hypothetical protein
MRKAFLRIRFQCKSSEQNPDFTDPDPTHLLEIANKNIFKSTTIMIKSSHKRKSNFTNIEGNQILLMTKGREYKFGCLRPINLITYRNIPKNGQDSDPDWSKSNGSGKPKSNVSERIRNRAI